MVAFTDDPRTHRRTAIATELGGGVVARGTRHEMAGFMQIACTSGVYCALELWCGERRVAVADQHSKFRDATTVRVGSASTNIQVAVEEPCCNDDHGGVTEVTGVRYKFQWAVEHPDPSVPWVLYVRLESTVASDKVGCLLDDVTNLCLQPYNWSGRVVF